MIKVIEKDNDRDHNRTGTQGPPELQGPPGPVGPQGPPGITRTNGVNETQGPPGPSQISPDYVYKSAPCLSNCEPFRKVKYGKIF